MTLFLNSPAALAEQSLAGLATLRADILRLGEGGRHIVRRTPSPGKVALVSGGGAGHEPMHCGFVGHGMLDAACQGPVFTSPTPDRVLAAAADVTGPQGALFIVKNYDGDRLNFDMAAEMASGHLRGPVRQLIVEDEAIDLSRGEAALNRRGLAGTMVVQKIVGAAAERGADLEHLVSLGSRVVGRTRTVGVAFPAPGAGEAPSDEIEFGVGIHGEPGRFRLKREAAHLIVARMVTVVLESLAPPPDARLLMVLNGFGGMPMIELQWMAGEVCQALRQATGRRTLTVARALTGNYVTCLDMAGCSLTLTLLDDMLLDLWDAPVHAHALRWGM
ncbi:MAG: dihydroxyacetone kinase subunit DhaK [Rhizobiaceae bacterium]|jgi:dihydroxyacetone kinase-like protein|nr:dihydroxyacetone kinase subunit DhaK [Rhizobiaceae bacterium]